jgi:hypothetical protein
MLGRSLVACQDFNKFWIDPQHLPELAALALAEHRAAARRLRLDRLHG